MGDFFSAADFTPRYMCGNWSDFMVGAYTISNFLIFVPYMTIPLALAYMIRNRETVKFSTRNHIWIRLSFILFIVFCGAGHLIDGVGAMIHPAYRFITAWHVATALVSCWVAVYLPIVIWKAGDDRGRKWTGL